MAKKLRTAVLCVHGIGSQRAQETVRGIVDAVWFDDDKTSNKKIWTHPERSTEDIDLVVMTTSETDAPDERSTDFHELYWAHLMSETRAVAVLLWLFELVRKGPLLKPGMRAVWWAGAIFLCLLTASLVLITLKAILALAHIGHEPQAIILAPFFVLFTVAAYGLFFATLRGATRLMFVLAAMAILTGGVFFVYFRYLDGAVARALTEMFLVISVALVVAFATMGWRGAIVMAVSYVVTQVFFFAIYLNSRWLIHWDRQNPLTDIWTRFSELTSYGPDGHLLWNPVDEVLRHRWIFLSLTEDWSAAIAWVSILLYLALNAGFLQPYLGDAARYFRSAPANVLVRRQIRSLAVDTLKYLHTCGLYDRIIVVAHSQGTVIAYDMLRAYFSQICNDLAVPKDLAAFKSINKAAVDPNTEAPEEIKKQFRLNARRIIAELAKGNPSEKPSANKTWLVTDFVTLGSPLTHARYLMCVGKTTEELASDFNRRVCEREFPTCPPKRLDGDDLLTFHNPRTDNEEFHHGALFGLTRWSNLYFPLRELFWGDAIGGPLQSVFGTHIRDIKVSGFKPPKDSFFAHNMYWNVNRGRSVPQIVALREVVDLADQA
jgi:hypothetical protein